jgi:enoyl-CoA hydratase/carnithine racemase
VHVSFSSDVLELKVDGHVATLWLNRPEARNALGRSLWHDLPLAAEAIDDDDDVRVVVLAARGPHFTVGLDLKEMGGGLTDGGSRTSVARANRQAYEGIRRLQDSVTALADLRVPVVAAVHGYCIGGGVDIICAADIRLAASDAVFSVREAKVAIVADLGTLQRLPKIVSAGHVAELALTAKDIDAARAAAIGLVNHVCEGSAVEVLEAAYEMADAIAANSPLAVQGTKAVLAFNDGATVDDGLEYVAQWNTAYLRSNDLTEAMTAFLERRTPTFRGD